MENQTQRPQFTTEQKSQAWALAKEIAKKLGERNQNPVRQIKDIVLHLGTDAARSLLTETLETEAQGGMMTNNGARRRTPGGVYFHLAKGRMTPEQRRMVFPYKHERKKTTDAQQAAVFETRPAFVWDARREIVESLLAEQGVLSTVKITLIGRPGKLDLRKEVVVTVMQHEQRTPTLPRGVPAPPETPTSYTVYISSKQWAKVEDAIRNEQDSLIIEGTCAYDNEIGMMAVYAMNVTTKLTEARKRQAQKEATDGETATPTAAPASRKAPATNQREPAPIPVPPPAPVYPVPEAATPEDAQKLRELHASAALFRQKIATLESKPEGQRFGLEMTRKLLKNVETDIAVIERKYD